MIQLKTQLTLEEFLALPEGNITYELIDGEAVSKFKNDEMAPKFFHSSITRSPCTNSRENAGIY